MSFTDQEDTKENTTASEGKIVVLVGPSGVGKSTIHSYLLSCVPGLRFAVSATSRAPRPGEVDGVEYHFYSPEEFQKLVHEGAFLEYEEVYPGRWYGTLFSELENVSSESPHVLLDIDVYGAQKIKERYGNRALTIFISPPSIEVLEERLRARGNCSPKDLEVRLQRVRDELNYQSAFDRQVVNNVLEEALDLTKGYVEEFLGVA